MIQDVTTVITKEINTFLRGRFDLSEDKVLLSGLIDQDGSVSFSGENKIVCSLINIEEDRTQINAGRVAIPKMNPPVRLNIYLMFSAFFSSSNYTEALKFITSVIAFFQRKQVFTAQNTPSLPSQVDKLTFELISLDLNETSNLWACLGAKYMPSVIYKIRMISIDENAILDEVPTVTGIGPDSSPK